MPTETPSLPDLLPHLAADFERYLTLHRVHPTRTYDYAKRGHFGFPVIEVEEHGPRCKIGESWMYVAVPHGADLARLADHERLYVGAQTQDRMFRGDGLDGRNFHHAQMRAGNGKDHPVAYLQEGGRIAIYRVSGQAISSRLSRSPELAVLISLTRQPRTSTRHLAWWFEQYRSTASAACGAGTLPPRTRTSRRRCSPDVTQGPSAWVRKPRTV